MSASCEDQVLKPCLGQIVDRQIYSSNIPNCYVECSSIVDKGNLKLFSTGVLW